MQKEKGFKTIVTASTGNAVSSLTGIFAAQNQKAIIIVPKTAPLAKLTQIIMYGATIVPVKVTYDNAFNLSLKASGEFDMCSWTTKPGTDVKEQITQYSYGFAAQVCILDDKGNISKMKFNQYNLPLV